MNREPREPREKYLDLSYGTFAMFRVFRGSRNYPPIRAIKCGMAMRKPTRPMKVAMRDAAVMMAKGMSSDQRREEKRRERCCAVCRSESGRGRGRNVKRYLLNVIGEEEEVACGSVFRCFGVSVGRGSYAL